MISPVKCLVISAMTVTVVNAHGWMTKPAATFGAEAGDKSQFIATIDSSTSGLKGTFNTAPADNVASFTKAFATSKYKSLKALIDDQAKITVTGATLTCGTADPDAAAQPLPTKLEWSHSDSEGFTASHEGPCEAWCDDVRVFEDENCAAHFTTAPAEMPYESSKCQGASKLTFYWMAMHGPSWQVYVNCANLSGGSGATKTDSSSATTTDSSSADTPTVSAAPSSGGSPSTTTGSSSDTPTVTSAPSTGGSPSTNTSPSTPAAQTPSTPSITTAPSTNTTPSTSTTSAPSTTTTDESDCDSYDIADESECGSYDIAGGSSDEAQDTTTQTSTNQVSNTGTNQWSNTNQGSNTGTNQWSNTGTNTNQWSNTGTGANTNQWSNTGTTQTSGGGNTNQNTGTGSQTSFNFGNFNGPANAGTVSPQYM